jgi:hypothetical protein
LTLVASKVGQPLLLHLTKVLIQYSDLGQIVLRSVIDVTTYKVGLDFHFGQLMDKSDA